MRLKMACLAALLVAASAFGAGKATVEGFLVDKMCASQHASEGEKFGAMHKRECALMPDCVKSGYGVVTPDGKYLKFDQAGDKKALAAIKASKKQDDLRVIVTGTPEGETFKVASLQLQ